MTFTATPQPSNVPPRVRLDIDTGDPLIPLSAITVKRDGQLLRSQPAPGSSVAVIYDYEAPFGRSVTYRTQETRAAYSALYSTAWPNLTGWTTFAGSPSVSGGKLVSGGVQRTLALPTTGKLEMTAPMLTGGAQWLQVGSFLRVERVSSNIVRVRFGNTLSVPSKLVYWTSGSLVVQWSDDLAIVTTPQATTSLEATANFSSSTLAANATDGPVPGFIISSQSSSTPAIQSATTTLAVSDSWLIHPSQPSLSIPMGHDYTSSAVRFIEASSGESKSSQAVSTVHRPVGRRRAVVITSGPRQADEWTLTIAAETIEAKNAIRSIVDDQTPLLLRTPPAALMDLPDDWYSVGDFTVTRVESPVITETTLATLPLTPVDEPIVRVGALWSWSDVLTTYSTWQDVLDGNSTWLDVLGGPS